MIPRATESAATAVQIDVLSTAAGRSSGYLLRHTGTVT